jgi:GGDEF domain-containing protein
MQAQGIPFNKWPEQLLPQKILSDAGAKTLMRMGGYEPLVHSDIRSVQAVNKSDPKRKIGRDIGDVYIHQANSMIEEAADAVAGNKKHFVARVGGDENVILVPHADASWEYANQFVDGLAASAKNQDDVEFPVHTKEGFGKLTPQVKVNVVDEEYQQRLGQRYKWIGDNYPVDTREQAVGVEGSRVVRLQNYNPQIGEIINRYRSANPKGDPQQLNKVLTFLENILLDEELEHIRGNLEGLGVEFNGYANPAYFLDKVEAEQFQYMYEIKIPGSLKLANLESLEKGDDLISTQLVGPLQQQLAGCSGKVAALRHIDTVYLAADCILEAKPPEYIGDLSFKPLEKGKPLLRESAPVIRVFEAHLLTSNGTAITHEEITANMDTLDKMTDQTLVKLSTGEAKLIGADGKQVSDKVLADYLATYLYGLLPDRTQNKRSLGRHFDFKGSDEDYLEIMKAVANYNHGKIAPDQLLATFRKQPAIAANATAVANAISNAVSIS